jgi:hypothetical protein
MDFGRIFGRVMTNPADRYIQTERERQIEKAEDKRYWEEMRHWDDRVWAAENEVAKATEKAKDASVHLMTFGGALGAYAVVSQFWGPWHSSSKEYELYIFVALILFMLGRAFLRQREASDCQAILTRIFVQRPRRE